MAKLPRGVRCHNPGNIEKGDPWQGLAEIQRDPRFCTFEAPRWGIRAICRILITYQDRHGLNTVRGIINRWAPPIENDTGAYVRHVADLCGVGPDDAINVFDYAVMKPLVQAIIRHENGPNPDKRDGRWYDDETVNAGLRLAGVEPPKKPIAKNPTVVGTGAAGAGVAAAENADKLQDVADQIAQTNDALQPLAQYSWIIPVVICVLSVAGVGFALWRIWEQRKAGG